MTEIRNPDAPATVNQIAFLISLANSNQVNRLSPKDAVAMIRKMHDDGSLSVERASRLINNWKTTPKRETPAEGYYILDTDLGPQYAHVRQNRAKTGLYAERLVDGHWTYEKGLVTQMTEFRPMTEQEIADFGHRTQRCLRCQAKLTDPSSRKAGYGPTCAKHMGL